MENEVGVAVVFQDQILPKFCSIYLAEAVAI